LREGSALMDNLYPSRIIIGSKRKEAYEFAELLKSCSLKEDINIVHMQPTEAEAVKLFANTYLAMRVAFFNELDSFSIENKLCSKDIIEGMSLDERIGNFYNNPSFGYGGYCLPKDTKQLLSQSNGSNNDLISSIVSSNTSRKALIVDEIIKLKPTSIGFFRLIMKEGSDNFRSSATQSILKKIIATNIKVYIYEPTHQENHFLNQEIITDLNEFKNKSDLIIANRNTYELTDVLDKVFSRDIFGEN
jgi:UDPglucose 6-dehydrogenase